MIKPFPFQRQGIDFLKSKKHCLLASEMGLGKTIQVIFAAKELSLKRIHIVCPAVAKYNWQNELLKFGIKSYVAGDGRTYQEKSVVISSFEYVTKHKENYLERKRDLLVIDEAHYLKEPTSQRTHTILNAKGLIHNADRLWALSGTPAPNHAGELWVWLYTFGLTPLSYHGFINRYCRVHQVGNYYSRVQIDGTNIKTASELKALLKQCSLRHLQSEVLKDLPPIFHNPYFIKEIPDSVIFDKNPELKTKLKEELEVIKEAIGGLEGFDNEEKLIETLKFLSQSVSSLRRYHGLKKVIPTAKLLSDELSQSQYQKVIVFGIHSDVLSSLFNELKAFKPVIIKGDTPGRQRQQAIESFQNKKDVRVFIGNIQAAGTAITLTASNQVVFIEQDWVPGNNQQAAKRAHRIGQTRPVNCRHIAIKNSLDEKITGTLTRKVREIATFI